jgi:murein DD-endopeptidase MepM/ murein hydrolase activator NlpD
MSCVVELLRSRARLRAFALTMTALGAAGCSSESTRFNENPYNSKAGPGEVTGSVTPAPTSRVETNHLPPPGGARPSTVAAAPVQPATSNSTGVAGGGRGMASFTPGSSSSSDVTGSVQAPPPPKPPEQWNWDGGTAVTVAPGETVEAIAHRHSVPVSAIMSANNLAPNGAIYPGQRLVIPRRSHAAVAPAAPAPTRVATAAPPAKPQLAAPPQPAPVSVAASVPVVRTAAAAPASAGVHVVVAGDTLSKISKVHSKPLLDILKANNLAPNARLNIGDRIVIPGVRTAAAPAKDAPNATQAKAAVPAVPAPKAPGRQASNEPVQAVNVVTPSSDAAPPANAHAKVAEAASPTFRWPVKGRVIAGFGPKTNGQQNDGINLAVPEGTPVKAAEDGVVAYAGNELKGYGNLVLVRHSNGYVTAYAHAKELLVKRGDAIKRGQTIANSGQTGNVDAPQLHFEIRKGPAPVDPLPMLGGG